ncbi:MAG: hypothetical protein M3O70_13950 [Actinomycetota bacterium]|nr:hypothetical protein [Actinomycetota bacterium]
MSQDLDELSEAKLAEWQYAHREELDADEGELVEAEVSPQFSVTMSFRLPGNEADAIREAAREAGMTLSEWIRQACADAAEPSQDGSRRHQVDIELEQAEKELDAMRKRLAAARKKNRRLNVGKKGNKSTAAASKKASRSEASRGSGKDRST